MFQNQGRCGVRRGVRVCCADVGHGVRSPCVGSHTLRTAEGENKGKGKEKGKRGSAQRKKKGLKCLIVTGVESPEQCQCEKEARRLERYAPRQPAKRIQVWWKSEAEVVNSPSWDRRSPSERRCRSSRASPSGDVLLSQSCGQCTTVRVVSL